MKRVAPSPVKEKPTPPKKIAVYDSDMESDSSRPASPTGGPLQNVTPDRVNQKRDSNMSALRSESRDNTVHDKINQFNNLSVSMQSRQLERKTADAALKRAMLGREEAESELKRYRDEAKMLRKAVEDGKERERKVGERLETVMEQYGRTKETHAHTKALWEKEIRRARKETFKTQSTTVKLQEELKAARSAVKDLEASLEHEKTRSHTREQEAFASRYQMVGLQEQIEQAMERIKLVEQERDAFKTAAQNEEVARIAAEGRIPLPTNDDPDDEFASPKKHKTSVTNGESARIKESRVSLSTMDIVSSEASEMEIEELSMQVSWERQRANRAQEMVEFLQAECQMHCCPCSRESRSRSRVSVGPSKPQQESPVVVEAAVETEDVPMGHVEPEEQDNEEPATNAEQRTVEHTESQLMVPKSKKERRSTIFCPQEGIFRTVSEQEAEAMQMEADVMQIQEEPENNVELDFGTSIDMMEPKMEPDSDADAPAAAENSPRMYARTPSVEPPAFALLAQQRTSLLSLLNAPQGDSHLASLPSMAAVPSVPDEADMTDDADPPQASPSPESDEQNDAHGSSTASYTVTTKVPVRDDNVRMSASMSEKLRTPSSGSNASFDLNDPALTPTMTREQALAKIRERRGRARSAAQGSAAAPQKKMVESGKAKRDLSAPTGQASARKQS